MQQELQISMKEEKFESAGGLKIYFRSWRPDGRTRGVVAIVPGFNSHSGYYSWVAEQLTANNLAVYALDLRGRGKSPGDRYFINRMSEYVSDVAGLVSIAKSRDQGLPVFLLGHSAGGVVSCVYTLEHQRELAGLICESFAYQVPAPKLALAVIKGVSHISPHAHVLRLKIDHFSRDPKVVEAMKHDPFVANEVQPSQTVAQMVLADERLKREFPKIKAPVLILHGTSDKVTKPSGSQFFYDTAGSSDKTLKLYDGHYHDLLNDIDKDRVITDIKGWIDSRIAG